MTHATPHRPLENLGLALVPATILVSFLFYIDEGWYSFKWMLEWGNWIVFIGYLIIITPVFWLMMQCMFRSQNGIRKALLVSAVGIPIVMVTFLVLLSL